MKRRAEVKNDVLFGFVMVAFFAVLVFNVAVEVLPGSYETLKVQIDEAVEARTLASAIDVGLAG